MKKMIIVFALVAVLVSGFTLSQQHNLKNFAGEPPIGD